MTPEQLTLLAAPIVTLTVSAFVPLWSRRGEVREARAREDTAARAAAASGSEVSMEALNRALMKQCDDLRAELKESTGRHREEIDRLYQMLYQRERGGGVR